MKKKLKQVSLFNKIKSLKLTFNVYVILYRIYQKETVEQSLLDKLPTALYSDGKLTEYSIKALESIDALFTTNKNIKVDELMGAEYKINIEKYLKTFPSEKLPSGKYARANSKNVEVNFKWFFNEYDYSWETILKATDMYVQEYKQNNYNYMRTAVYFIRKDDGTRTVLSDLADYCNRIEDGESYSSPKIFKTTVI